MNLIFTNQSKRNEDHLNLKKFEVQKKMKKLVLNAKNKGITYSAGIFWKYIADYTLEEVSCKFYI